MLVIQWVGDDLFNLLNLDLNENYYIYSRAFGVKRVSLKRIRNKKIEQYNSGKTNMPPRSEAYPGKDQEVPKAQERQAKLAQRVGRDLVPGTVEIAVREEHLRYHEQLEKALEDNGLLSKARFSDYQMGYKDSDGEAQSHDLHASKFELLFEHEPLWDTVKRIESVKLPKKEVAPKSDARRAVILPDLQIPFQDEKAVEVALKIVRDVKPDKIVLLGDMLDLSAWSKYTQKPEWALQTQDAIVYAHKLLATLRMMCPSAEIVVLAGNHDARMENQMLQNLQAAYRLKRADQLDGYPVMSVPYLCAFDQLDIEYIPGYPANRYWINDRLQARHGSISRNGASTAKAISNDERVSTIFGHIHKLETHYQTKQVREGGRTNAAFSPGCLCKIDGSVPGTNTGYDTRTNQALENYANWQHGLMVVDYEDGDSAFYPQQIFINTFNDYEARYNGKTYRPKELK